MAGSACRRMARGRLAFQPEYRVATLPVSGMCTSTRDEAASGSTVSVPAVGPSDVSERYVAAFAVRSSLSRSSATGYGRSTAAREARRERAIVLGDPRPCARGIRSAAR